jgi:hypothetical protein
MMVATLGLGIAKQVFQVRGVDQRGNVVPRRSLRREQVAAFFADLSPCLVGLEACGKAHHRAGRLSLKNGISETLLQVNHETRIWESNPDCLVRRAVLDGFYYTQRDLRRVIWRSPQSPRSMDPRLLLR